MNISSLIIALSAAFFFISCGGNKETDNTTKTQATAEVQPLVYESFQNNEGDILYIAQDPNDNTVHIKAKGEEFLFDKENDDSTPELSNGEVSFSQKDGETILKRNGEIIFEQKPKLIAGQLNLGHNENTIVDCATGRSVWINDKTGKLQGIYDNLIDNKDKAYNPIFVKVKAVDRGKTSEGPSSEFNSVFDIIEIISSRKATDNDCLE